MQNEFCNTIRGRSDVAKAVGGRPIPLPISEIAPIAENSRPSGKLPPSARGLEGRLMGISICMMEARGRDWTVVGSNANEKLRATRRSGSVQVRLFRILAITG